MALKLTRPNAGEVQVLVHRIQRLSCIVRQESGLFLSCNIAMPLHLVIGLPLSAVAEGHGHKQIKSIGANHYVEPTPLAAKGKVQAVQFKLKHAMVLMDLESLWKHTIHSLL